MNTTSFLVFVSAGIEGVLISAALIQFAITSLSLWNKVEPFVLRFINQLNVMVLPTLTICILLILIGEFYIFMFKKTKKAIK